MSRRGVRRLGALLTSVCLVGGGAVGIVLSSSAPASADTVGPINFESYSLGSVNGQDSWTSTGAYDQAIVNNTGYPGAPFPGFGTQSLRISDAVTSGSFGDQTFSKPVVNAAGEPTADTGGFPTGTLQTHFESSFDFASVLAPAVEQHSAPGPGCTPTLPATECVLHMSVSPDRGDGARMSYVRIEDSSGGWKLFFDDYQDVAPLGSGGNLDDGCAPNANSGGAPDGFTDTLIASGVTRAKHTVTFLMNLLPGPHNDVVSILLDGTVIKTGTSWEDYYRYCAESGGGTAAQIPGPPGGTIGDKSRIVRNVLFREAGDSNTNDAGKGFLIDNFSAATLPLCTTVCYVDAVNGSDANTGTSPARAFKTIQFGVNTVSPTGTVDVAAGTYDESVTINKAVTLNGANVGVPGTAARGAESLVERLAAQSGPAFNITTSDPVVIDGFNAQFNGTDAVGGVLLSTQTGNVLTFKNSLVNNSAYSNALFYDTSATTSTLTNNKFTGISQPTGSCTGVAAIWGVSPSPLAAVNVTGNTFTAITDTDGCPAINFNAVKGTISGNTFQNIHQYGIILANELGPLAITNNLFDNIFNDTPLASQNRGSGIRTFMAPTFVAPVTITGNTFSNSYHGVRIVGDGPAANLGTGNVLVNRNAITGMISAGISAAAGTTGTLNGKCNWWGTPAGPGVGGTDNAVIDASSWLVTSDLNGPCGLPTAPTIVSVTPVSVAVSPTSVSVAFTPGPLNGDPASFFTATCISLNGRPPVSATGGASPIIVPGLFVGEGYVCSVTATNNAGTGPPSGGLMPVWPTRHVVACGPVPSAPFNLTTGPADRGAQVSWAPSATGCIAGFVVTPYLNGVAQPATLIPGHGTTTVIKGLTTGSTYTFTVAGENGIEVGPASVQSPSVIVGTPGVPGILSASRAGRGALKVSFRAAAANGAKVVTYTATCSSIHGVTRSRVGKSAPITVTGLTSGRTYTCTVKATNSRGTGRGSKGSAPVTRA